MSGLEKIFLVAAGFGIVTEIVARLFRFWLYRNAVSPILNIVGMFGVVQGVCIAGLIGRGQPLLSIAPVLFMTGATIGIAYEGLNEFALHGWTWPEGRLLGLSARATRRRPSV